MPKVRGQGAGCSTDPRACSGVRPSERRALLPCAIWQVEFWRFSQVSRLQRRLPNLHAPARILLFSLTPAGQKTRRPQVRGHEAAGGISDHGVFVSPGIFRPLHPPPAEGIRRTDPHRPADCSAPLRSQLEAEEWGSCVGRTRRAAPAGPHARTRFTGSLSESDLFANGDAA